MESIEDKMKIFQTIQKNHAKVGISPTQNRAVNKRIVVTFLLFGLTFVSSVTFLFRDANTFIDYSNNMYITTGQAMIFIVYAIVTFNMVKLFGSIDNLEELINQSKFGMSYSCINSNILYLCVAQDWNSVQKQSMKKPIDKLKNGVKLPIFYLQM